MNLKELIKETVIQLASNSELADWLELYHEDTTTGMNGYPENVKEAIVSNSLRELEEIAEHLKSLGFEVTKLELHRKEGWHLWNRKSIPFFTEGQYMQANDQDYYFDYDPKWDEDQAKEELFNLVVGEGTPIENYAILNHWHERINNLYDEMCNCSELTRFFLDADNEYTIDYSVSSNSSGYYDDTNYYQLAIMVEDFDIDED